MREANRDAVRGLLERGAQLVDVLPRAEHEEEHLAGAMVTTSDGRLVGLFLGDDSEEA